MLFTIRPPRPIATRAVVLTVAVGVLGGLPSAHAGGGPENVMLVVNANSEDSKTVANYYIKIRGIPATNVAYVNWRGGHEECQGPYFWSDILEPVIKTINQRNLASQIDYIVYSSDIPWRVYLQPLFPEKKFSRQRHPIGSSTGVTYLWQFLRDKNPSIVAPVVNWYVAPDEGDNYVRCQKLGKIVSRGFRGRHAWDKDGQQTTKAGEGLNYFLSTSLGVTTGRGNSLKEVVQYLARAAKADGTRPRGTIYYMKNNDVRSQTRHDCYDGAVEQLARLGVSARVVRGKVPQGAKDVAGVMAGIADFDFAKSRSKIVPGAICSNLTSLGGALTRKAGQTPLTEFLRHGAAGASGTVFEPMAQQCKFPLPSLHLHYARGCSLAESFYQSVSSPYQLLVVGDPLCQPWATFPVVNIVEPKPGQEIKGKLPIKATAKVAPNRRVGSMELFIDGRLVVRYPAHQAPEIDTTQLSDGYHELRVVAVDADPIETRGRSIVPIRVNNHDTDLEFSATFESSFGSTGKVRISARQTGATAIVVRHNSREVARIDQESGEVEVLAATLGRGPLVLQAESLGEHPTVSEPVTINVN